MQPNCMVISPNTDSDIYKQCLTLACDQSRGVMVSLVQQAVAIMQAKQNTLTDMRERIQWDDDTRALLLQREVLADRFPAQLRKAIKAAADAQSTSSNQGSAAALAEVRFDTLELVDDAKVQNQIDTARVQQAVDNACERELAELDALVCAARGFKTVKPELNPLRPSAFCRAVVGSLEGASASDEQRSTWMQIMGGVLGAELRKLYSQLVTFLKNERVEAVGYSVNFLLNYGGGDGGAAQSGGQGTAVGGHSLSASPPSMPAPFKRERLVNAPKVSVGQLRQVLGQQHFSHLEPAPESLPASASEEEILQDLDVLKALLQQLGGQPSGDYSLAVRAAKSKLGEVADGDESVLHTSRAGDLSVHESFDDAMDADQAAPQTALVQDVVRLMVDELCQDQRLLPCVRDWIGSLEPALLALACVDASFLSVASHPVRSMLDEVSSRSLGFGAQHAEGFADFFDPVLAACSKIQPNQIDTVQPFAQAWQAIEEAWNYQKTTALAQRDQVVQALVDAEQRNVLAEKIAFELTRRGDARFAPIFVKQFVAGVWAQVIAKARLEPQSSAQSAQYLHVVEQLLWSAVPEETAKDIKRLISLIPPMLTTLRAGLCSIGSSEQQDEVFFAQLMQLHQSAVKMGSQKPVTDVPTANLSAAMAVDVQAAVVSSYAIAEDADLAEDAETAVWLAPQEILDAGFVDAEVSAPVVLVVSQTLGDDGVGSAADSADNADSPGEAPQPAQLQGTTGALTEPPMVGSWVEFLSHGTWVRAQLTWASPHGTLYMFTGAAGNPHSMTRRALDKMLSRQAMRTLEQSSIVTNALNSVAQSASRHASDVNA